MIMRDVMQGMIGFTQEACCGSEMAKMEILAVEEAENYTQQSAAIIPFPRENKSKR